MKIRKNVLLLIFSFIVEALFVSFIVHTVDTHKVGINKTEDPNTWKKTCPFVVTNIPVRYLQSNLLGEVKVTFPPVLISPTPNIGIINKPFDPRPSNIMDNWKFSPEYAQNPNSNPWSEKDFDVDGDGKDEKILTASVAMNHTPHIVEIVKDNKIIFEKSGASVGVEPTYDHNGFFFTENLDWNVGTWRKTRYISSSGKFVPIWYQDSCSVI